MQLDAAVIEEFAPKGTLRFALNHGNRILVRRAVDGTPTGIAVDLALALSEHLGLECAFVEYERAVDVSSSAETGEWDVCFLAVDPERARTLTFTEPYVQIQGCYLAGPVCPLDDADALRASGLPVGTVKGSAYTLTLQRVQGAADLVVFDDIHTALDALDGGTVSAIAGIRAVMEAEGAKRPGARVLLPPFMEIRQAMAMPRSRPRASETLAIFLTNMVRSGRLSDILEAHGVDRTSAVLPD